MLGMLIVNFRRPPDRRKNARRAPAAHTFPHMGCSTADLDVGSVGLEHPSHRVLAAPIAVISVVLLLLLYGYASACFGSDRFSCLAFISALKFGLSSSISPDRATPHAHRVAVQF